MQEARIARYRGMEYSEVTSSPLDILSNSNLGAAKARFLNSMQRFRQLERLTGCGIVTRMDVFVAASPQARRRMARNIWFILPIIKVS
jgi:hypothetical protein